MTARERLAEYATLKALGFGPAYVAALIVGESVVIAAHRRAARHRLRPSRSAHWFGSQTGTLFPIFEVSPLHAGDAGRLARSSSALAAAVLPATPGRAGSHRRRFAGHRLMLPFPTASQPLDAQAHHGAHRRRHGAGGVRLRRGADARCGCANAGGDRAPTTSWSPAPAADRGAERRRARAGGDRRDRSPDASGGGERWRRRKRVVLIHLPKRAGGAASQRHGARALAGGHRAAAAGADRRRPHVPPRHRRDHRRQEHRRALRRRRPRRAAALRRARLDRGRGLRRRRRGFDSEIWGDVDQLMQSFRRQAYSSVVAGSPTRTGSSRSSAGSRPTRASPSKPSASASSTRSSRRRWRTSSASSASR